MFQSSSIHSDIISDDVRILSVNLKYIFFLRRRGGRAKAVTLTAAITVTMITVLVLVL